MPRKSYHEGWGYSDTIKLVVKGEPKDASVFYREFKKTFPKEQVNKTGKEVVEVYVYEREIPLVKKLAKIFDLKIAYSGGGGTGGQEIARTILTQLGGQGRLVVMTGAYNFIALKNGVSFKIKNRKVNYIKIELNGKDLYDMTFGKIYGGNFKILKEHNDIYNDQLIPIFEKETGMYLKLFKRGGITSSQNRDMVLSQLKSIHHHEEELRRSIKTSSEVEAWVLAKVQRATTDLSDVTHFIDGKTEYKTGGSVDDNSEINQILKRLERAYLIGKRDLQLMRDKEQIQNPIYRKEMWETAVGIEGELYQWLKKYDIIGENTLIYINNSKELNEWKSKIKQLKSNGYSVVTQVSAPSKDKLKRYRYIAIKQKFATGGTLNDDQMLNEMLFREGGNTPNKPVMNGIVGLDEEYDGDTEDYIEPLMIFGYDQHWKDWKPTTVELRKTRQLLNEDLAILKKMGIQYTYELSEFSDVPIIKIEVLNGKPATIDNLKQIVVISEDDTITFREGGKTPEFIDLFEDYENIPSNVQEILDNYSDSFEDGDYQGLNKAHAELGKIGYTFEFYLDGVAYGLRPENIELNQLKGYEQFAKGGSTAKKFKKGETITGYFNYNYTYDSYEPSFYGASLEVEGEVINDDGEWVKIQWGNPIDQVDTINKRVIQGMWLSEYEQGGLSIANANPYIAGAKAVQGIAPESVSALDKKMASRINPDPNRPVFFAIGGKVGDFIQFKGFDDEVRTGTILEELGNDKYSVSSGFGQVLVDSNNYVGMGERPMERKKLFGFFKEGGEIFKHKHSLNWGEDIKIELIEPTKKGWKVTQTITKGRSKKTKTAYFSVSEIQELFEKI